MSEKFDIGDVVQLRCGGPLMVVRDMATYFDVNVNWLDPLTSEQGVG